MNLIKRTYIFHSAGSVVGAGTAYGEQDFSELNGTIYINKVTWDWQYKDQTTNMVLSASSPGRACEVRLTIQPQPLIPFIGEPPSAQDLGGGAAMVGGYFYLYNPGCHIFEALKCGNDIKVRASILNYGANTVDYRMQVLISATIVQN